MTEPDNVIDTATKTSDTLKAQWLFHPDSPGEFILVVRGFWGRLFKSEYFATLTEVQVYYAWKQALYVNSQEHRA